MSRARRIGLPACPEATWGSEADVFELAVSQTEPVAKVLGKTVFQSLENDHVIQSSELAKN